MKLTNSIAAYVLIGLIASIAIAAGILLVSPAEPVVCGCGVVETELVAELQEFDSLQEVDSTKRRIRKVWFDGKAPAGLSVEQFQAEVMAGLNKLSLFTLTDFTTTAKKSGAQIRIVVSTDATMWKYFPQFKAENKVPAGAWAGGLIHITERGQRFVNFPGFLSAVAQHEFGHQLGMKHTSDISSIMHLSMPSFELNARDRDNFAARLGRRK